MSAKGPEDLFFHGLGGVSEDTPAPSGSKEDAHIDAVETAEAEGLDKTAQQVNRPVSKSNLFSHPEAHPFVLDMALLKTFQLDWLKWDPDTLFSEIRETFSTSVADVNRMKILATMTLHVVDAFWEQWDVFENTILALNGVIPRIGHMQPPDAALLMAGVDIVASIREEEYSDEVSRYTAACLLNEGVTYAPKPLEFCQQYVSQPRYHCTHCGKKGSALPPFDGRCDSCSRRFEDHPFNFKPAEDAKDDKKDVEYSLTYDPSSVKKRYEELVSLHPSKVRIQETADDIESARLIIATDYMSLRRRQRDRQLSQIKNWMVTHWRSTPPCTPHLVTRPRRLLSLSRSEVP